MAASTQPAASNDVVDVVVYGGTAGGVMAAVAAARRGRSVTLVEPQVRVGGMVSGGLDKTDLGDRATIGGLAAEFFQRCLDYYTNKYGAKSQQVSDSFHGYYPEPKVAQAVFEKMLADTGKVQVLVGHRLKRTTILSGRIRSITVEDIATGNDSVLSAKVFVDTSYEGDLMAQAGVPYIVGRESRAQYGESLAGVNFMNSTPRDVSRQWLDSLAGRSDGRIQAYNIRATITNNPTNRVPFPKPAHYDPTPFAGMKQGIIQRHLKSMVELFGFLPGSKMPNGEFDPNVSDKPGNNYTYPDGSWPERERIYEKVRDNFLSMFYMLANDPELPSEFHADLTNNWGLPADEFVESGNITPQIYVREARRMIGAFVLTQDDVRNNRFKPDSICLGSYNIDCHFTETLTTPHGTIEEGSMTCGVDPWEVPYRCLVPPNIINLLVGSAVSATHVAYSTLRMEPVYMMIGHACGLAADLAARNDLPVQQIDLQQLRGELRDAHMPLEAPYRPVIAIDAPISAEPGTRVAFKIRPVDVRAPLRQVQWNFDGTGAVQAEGETASFTYATAKPQQVSVVASDTNGKQTNLSFDSIITGSSAPVDIDIPFNIAHSTGSWQKQWAGETYDRRGYFVAKAGDGAATVKFQTTVPVDGTYAICMAVPFSPQAASNVTLKVIHGDSSEIKFDERQAGSPFIFRPIGRFALKAHAESSVEMSAAGTDGEVAVDAVRWVYLGK
ncbi:MAG: FAD-dependent oxidoreductase [Phycisphaerae bacterium]|nr:FAD-dependent oxidoreductase [Phycisphaerae bacterium]